MVSADCIWATFYQQTSTEWSRKTYLLPHWEIGEQILGTHSIGACAVCVVLITQLEFVIRPSCRLQILEIFAVHGMVRVDLRAEVWHGLAFSLPCAMLGTSRRLIDMSFWSSFCRFLAQRLSADQQNDQWGRAANEKLRNLVARLLSAGDKGLTLPITTVNFGTL